MNSFGQIRAPRLLTAFLSPPAQPCATPLDCQRERTGRRFLLLLYVQWIAAICVATWLTPHAYPAARVPDGTLLLFAFLGGGVTTLAAVVAVRLWSSRRPARVIIGICQMLMSAVLLHLTQGHMEMHFHVYGSLALLAVYADWAVLTAAASVVIGDQMLIGHVGPGSLLSASFESNWPVLGESLKLMLWNALLLWSGRDRVKELKRLGQQQKRQQALLHRAFHDRSTGLPNRAALEPQLDKLLKRGTAVSCMYLEVERVSCAEERLGPMGGETLLRSMLARVQDCAHHDDRLGRIACDKFVIVVHRPHTRTQMSALADSIVRCMAEPHVINGHAITTAVSIGIASTPTDAHDRESLLVAADRTVYAARCEGRNIYRFACDLRTPADEHNAVLAMRLERALQKDELHLAYQPIFSIDERMVAVEALARWRAEDGPISPGEFIPVAESTGLIVPLSNWVLLEACSQMAQWVTLGTTLQRIAVNVSVKHVWRDDFVATVEHTLLQTGLKPSRLELEVTESALAADFETVKRNLQALRKLGVRISIDDFGTGYSSLSRVRELYADTLKIDRTFVQGACDTPSGMAVVQTIIDMAHTLNMSVVAEGVETLEQLQMLRSMRCDELQGFLLSRPQPAAILTAALRNAAAKPRQEQGLRLVPRLA